MNNRQILEKAIQKAIDGGWKPEVSNDSSYQMHIDPRLIDWKHTIVDDNFHWLIFIHDFARHLWGEEPRVDVVYHYPLWEFHLQQMVIAEDPIKYLGENI